MNNCDEPANQLAPRAMMVAHFLSSKPGRITSLLPGVFRVYERVTVAMVASFEVPVMALS